MIGNFPVAISIGVLVGGTAIHGPLAVKVANLMNVDEVLGHTHK